MYVLITGAAGAGTTTLGRALADEWRAPLFDADHYYWLPTDPPYTTRRSEAERLSLLSAALRAQPDGIVAGSIMRWGEEIEDAFDVIVFLYVETPIRLQRIRTRDQQKFGRVNPDFLAWAAQYDEGWADGRSLARHEAWLASRRCPIIRLSGDAPVAELLSRLTAELPKPQAIEPILKR